MYSDPQALREFLEGVHTITYEGYEEVPHDPVSEFDFSANSTSCVDSTSRGYRGRGPRSAIRIPLGPG